MKIRIKRTITINEKRVYDVSFFLLIGSVIALLFVFYMQDNEIKETQSANQYMAIDNSSLANILKAEIVNLGKGKVCRDYAEYYNKTLSEKYPLMDIRWLRYIDLCNNQTLCDTYHTFLVVAYDGSECMFDQSTIKCINYKLDNKNNKNN